jgi:hypothetical protein
LAADPIADIRNPRISVESQTDEEIVAKGRFASRKDAKDWIAEKQAAGVEFSRSEIGKSQQYFPGTGKIELLFGTREGLQAVGYLAQTYLAHYFPDIARTAELDDFKRYTLESVGDDRVWWDFDPQPWLGNNAFDFGHRVIVGLDSSRKVVYARISLFSTLNFSTVLGRYDGEASRSVITDIDPLAEHPPNDIAERRLDTAVATVTAPNHKTASLSEAIRTGKAGAAFVDLLKRIEDRNRRICAETILEQIAGAGAMDADVVRPFSGARLSCIRNASSD